MDFIGLLFIVLMIILGIAILSILPVLTFFLYRKFKAKGKIYKYGGLTFFSLTTIGMIVLVINIIISPSGFGPEYESIEIKQNIGGKLLCESVYNADLHSWQYDVTYKYLMENGDSINLGYGGYYGRQWDKNEQLIKQDNWLILKTGSFHGSDRIILKNTKTDSTIIYDINNQFIENDILWRNQEIKSLINYCCAESFIEKISNNKVFVKYKFRTSETLTKEYGERMIEYRLNNTGQLMMTNIK
ncbi:hypothetical protein P700755_002646 [Psychroflexus torquis ATCC 700755]|uniref:Uncharacterized protein n=1 Tax=Psychroflexus torquis (strain ATCC 700755 / CIP 106069 / ACAM 623) TaxID=313595 RepID=K4IHV2_PSYTT|nr:hypothetical protein [Psychroflexus torquis]AFU69393.1 hypothetical protein P700755_002646 [Psychroflexus torquis ATCC 700755]